MLFASDISQIWTDLIFLSVKYHILHIPDVSLSAQETCPVKFHGEPI